MIRTCGTCGKAIDDRHDQRFTIKGDTRWYCVENCAAASMVTIRVMGASTEKSASQEP